jgi:hypothetical protein
MNRDELRCFHRMFRVAMQELLNFEYFYHWKFSKNKKLEF